MINLEDVLKALAKARVNFVVIGGFAIVAQGSGLVTRDLDICYERTPENLTNLVAALAPYHVRLRVLPKTYRSSSTTRLSPGA